MRRWRFQHICDFISKWWRGGGWFFRLKTGAAMRKLLFEGIPMRFALWQSPAAEWT